MSAFNYVRLNDDYEWKTAPPEKVENVLDPETGEVIGEQRSRKVEPNTMYAESIELADGCVWVRFIDGVIVVPLHRVTVLMGNA